MYLNVLSYSGYGIDWMCHLNIEIFYGTIAMFIVVLVTILFHAPKKVSLFPLLILIVSSNNKILCTSKHKWIFYLFLGHQESESATGAMEDCLSNHLLLIGNLHVVILREEVY